MMTRLFESLLALAVVGLGAALGTRLAAQTAPPATAQPGSTQPAPSREVSPVTPRGRIRLTATEQLKNWPGVSPWRVQ